MENRFGFNSSTTLFESKSQRQIKIELFDLNRKAYAFSIEIALDKMRMVFVLFFDFNASTNNEKDKRKNGKIESDEINRHRDILLQFVNRQKGLQ